MPSSCAICFRMVVTRSNSHPVSALPAVLARTRFRPPWIDLEQEIGVSRSAVRCSILVDRRLRHNNRMLTRCPGYSADYAAAPINGSFGRAGTSAKAPIKLQLRCPKPWDFPRFEIPRRRQDWIGSASRDHDTRCGGDKQGGNLVRAHLHSKERVTLDSFRYTQAR